MADNFGGDEFYNFNYDQQQQQSSAGYDMGGNNFGQDPQFAQFDYGQQQQGYGDQNAYGGNRDQFAGHIFTPEPVQQYDPNAGGENYDEEPPLMEELGINFDHITQKTLAVLNPLKQADHTIMQDTDLAGPLVFCLAFGGTLMLSGKLSFGYIYGIGVVGCLAMYTLLNLMSMTGVSVGCIISVLGYCLLPMVILSFSAALLSLQGMLGILITVLAVIWCSASASKLFVSALSMDHQQPLVAYPCALVYGVFALLTVF